MIKPPLFRDRSAGGHSAVTYIELFFDLVFVFAITQLSYHLKDHLTVIGSVQTLLMLLAIWWVWIYTSWATNWLNPDCGQVRLVLMALMVGGLLLAIAIPDAFGARGDLFAFAYCAMQIGRTLYIAWASGSAFPARRRNFLRISFWFLLSLPFWLAGAALPADLRLWCWLAALAIEYAGPFLFFRTPGLGASTVHDWDISGTHMAERCALFIIIVLGEAILVTGATFAQLPHDAVHWGAFLICFGSSAAMWWIYFDIGAIRASAMIGGVEHAGQIARNGYTYLHLPIVAGLVATAVGDAKMLSYPSAVATSAFLLTAIGGPALFLLGNQAFKWLTSGHRYPPLSHFVGGLGLVATAGGAVAWGWTQLTVGALVMGALVLTAGWEWLSLNGGWQRWMPWLGHVVPRRVLPGGVEDTP